MKRSVHKRPVSNQNGSMLGRGGGGRLLTCFNRCVMFNFLYFFFFLFLFLGTITDQIPSKETSFKE